MLSRLPYATAEKNSANSVSAAKLDFNSQTSATTCCESDGSNIRIVNLMGNDNFNSESDIDKSDMN